MKKLYSYTIKISITLALLIFLFRKVDFRQLFDVVRNSDCQKMLIAFFLFFILNIFVMGRWFLLLRGIDIHVRPHRLFLSYLSSLFFNLFLPSTIGGDAVRTLDIAEHTRKHSSGILATVVLDRVGGFLGLITVLVFSLIYGYSVFNDASILVATVVLLLLVVFFMAMMFSQRFLTWILRFLPFEKLKTYVFKMHDVTSSYRDRRGILWGVWLISIACHIGLAFVYYFLAQSIGVHLKLIYFLILVPMITVISSIPVSIGGLGVRDAASVFAFAKVGVLAEKAFALSLINFGFMAILGLLGGISYVFILYRRRI